LVCLHHSREHKPAARESVPEERRSMQQSR
jgi:hypothetical protein